MVVVYVTMVVMMMRLSQRRRREQQNQGKGDELFHAAIVTGMRGHSLLKNGAVNHCRHGSVSSTPSATITA